MEHDIGRTLVKGVTRLMVIGSLGLCAGFFMVELIYCVPVFEGDGHYCNCVNALITD